MKPLAWLALVFTTGISLFGQTATVRHADVTGGPLRGIATSNTGLMVAVGANGRILTSLDGTVWTARNSGVPDNFTALTASGSGFIATTDRGRILASSDGISWSIVYSGTAPLNAIEGYTAVGDFGTIVTTTNGRDWAQVPSSTTNALRGIVSPSIVGDRGTWLQRDRTWQRAMTDTEEDFTAIAYSHDSLVVSKIPVSSSDVAVAITDANAYFLSIETTSSFGRPTPKITPTTRPGKRPIRCLASSGVISSTTTTPLYYEFSSSGSARVWLAIDDTGVVFLGRAWQPVLTLSWPATRPFGRAPGIRGSSPERRNQSTSSTSPRPLPRPRLLAKS